MFLTLLTTAALTGAPAHTLSARPEVDDCEKTERLAEAQRILAEQPLTFMENRGQWPPFVRFATRGGAARTWVTDEGLLVQLVTQVGDDLSQTTVDLKFRGASKEVSVVGEKPLPSQHGFFVGSAAASGIRGFGSVLYEGLLPGVDMRLREQDGHVEYDILLRPGADPSSIVVDCSGALGLHLEADGTLVMETALGPVTQAAPYTFEMSASGEQKPVTCRYRLLSDTSFGFEVEWDGTTDLVIDPGLVWQYAYDGTCVEIANDVKIGPSGDIYVGGQTASFSFPITSNAFDNTPGVGCSDLGYKWDGFVGRILPNGTLAYSTYYGGTDEDAVTTVDVIEEFDIEYCVFGGVTDSADFPTAGNNILHPTPLGGRDGFLALMHLGGGGSFPDFSTYFGTSGDDGIMAVAVTAAHEWIVAGFTDGTFAPSGPTTSGLHDAFVGQLDRFATTRQHITLLGGESEEVVPGYDSEFVDKEPMDLVLLPSGDIVVTSCTISPDFPVQNPVQSYQGGIDMFVSRLSSDFTTLQFSTFLGGSGDEVAHALAVDGSDACYVAGWSDSLNFPTVGAYDPGFNHTMAPFGNQPDGVLARLDTAVGSQTYGTYFGSRWEDSIRAVAVDCTGKVVIVGLTYPSETTLVNGGIVISNPFPLTPGAFDTSITGEPQPPNYTMTPGFAEGFFARIDPAVSGHLALHTSSLYGADIFDALQHVALVDPDDAVGDFLIVGQSGPLTFAGDVYPYTSQTLNGPTGVHVTEMNLDPWSHFGEPFIGASGEPVITMQGPAQVGTTVNMLLTNPGPATQAFIFASASKNSSSDGSSGQIHVSGTPINLGALPGNTTTSIPFNVDPAHYSVCDVIYVQLAIYDPSVAGNYALSRALEIVVTN